MNFKIKNISNAVFVLVISVLLSGTILAQPGGGRGGRNSQQRMYDVNTVTTVSGEITSVETLEGRRGGMGGGIHAVLKTGSESVSVHLGPQSYLSQQGITVEKGDKVSIRGSKITMKDKPVIIAAEITRNGKTVKLRDDNGMPLWRGSMKK